MPKKTILLVDDEEFTLQSVKIALGATYHVLSEKTSAGALKRLQKAQDISLIILDIMIDERSGFDVLDELGGMNVRLPVIVLSALDEAGAAATAFKKGAIDYVVKPFHSKELAEAVKEALGGE